MTKSERARALIAGVTTLAPVLVLELLFVAAFVCLVRGAWLFAEPAGWIVAGVILLCLAVGVARRKA